MKPLRKDDDSDDDVNIKRAKMSANRETKILNELEMCERTGDVVFRASSKMKNECVFRFFLDLAELEIVYSWPKPFFTEVWADPIYFLSGKRFLFSNPDHSESTFSSAFLNRMPFVGGRVDARSAFSPRRGCSSGDKTPVFRQCRIGPSPQWKH